MDADDRNVLHALNDDDVAASGAKLDGEPTGLTFSPHPGCCFRLSDTSKLTVAVSLFAP